MGLYSEQIADRIRADQDAFELSFAQLASVVMGHTHQVKTFLSDKGSAKNAIEEILKYYNVVSTIELDGTESIDDQLEHHLHPTGIMRRKVELTGKWYVDGIGPMLGQTVDGRVISLIPGKTAGYTFFDHRLSKRVRVNKRNFREIGRDAFCFYNPLPVRKIGVYDLLLYVARSLSVSDYFATGLAVLAVTLLGFLIPYAYNEIFTNIVPFGNSLQLLSISVLLAGTTISTMLIKVTQSVVLARISTKTDIAVQSAAMSRLLSLPPAFFKEYTSGEIAQRLTSLVSLSGVLTRAILGAGLSGFLSLLYISQIAMITPFLTAPALLIILTSMVLIIANAVALISLTRKQMTGAAKLSGLEFSLISGVQKIKLAGCERRAFSKWAMEYAQNAMLSYAPPFLSRIAPVITAIVPTFGAIVLFSAAASAGISVAEYMAFNASYALLSGAILSLASVAMSTATIVPTMSLVKPIMEATPETSTRKKILNMSSGSIDINNLSFRYTEDSPNIIDDLSIRINRGQYVAIVGASGCGKSTLLRLLLGFEEPQKGAIYYDKHDLKTIDLKSLRRTIGCVVQNSKLMTGSLYDNIIVSAPWLSINEAWEAAEAAGISDEIKEMPMGMHTLVTDGGGGLSGGQKQRILIARALAQKPRLLFLDEATSALDNITQKRISERLDKLKCTRIIIAHRLSTIRHCDRVIMLEQGKIIEEGTYDELMALGGKFTELVERQRLEG